LYTLIVVVAFEKQDPRLSVCCSRMPRDWQWDATLYQGSAAYYERGRLPYPAGLAEACAGVLGLDRTGRLLDVGCGPGIIALRLARLFEQVVGLDADADMLAQAARRAFDLGVANARWVHALAEDLPLDLGTFRVATFAQSFHWMDRERVAAAVRDMLEPGGAFVQVSARTDASPEPSERLAHPFPPRAAIEQVVLRHLGPVRRAGQGLLRHGLPGDEAAVLRHAGFGEPEIVRVPGGEVVERSADDVIAALYSNSAYAPHLFGARLAEFEAEIRLLLAEASPSGQFAEQTGDAELRVWRTPA
jgi:SAM-dependent methyltransferase